MKILALIPARGGSKRLPKKNIKPLGGEPLIVWTLKVAKEVPFVSDIIVSTDDPKIAQICEASGVRVPWLRPYCLSTDTTTSVDVALHALDWYGRNNIVFDGLLLLQPTSPFRNLAQIKKGIDLFLESNFEAAVVGVSRVKLKPDSLFSIANGTLSPLLNTDDMSFLPQDFSDFYEPNGSFYLVSPTHLRENRSFFAKKTLPLVEVDPMESIDIDTDWDFRIASALLEKINED